LNLWSSANSQSTIIPAFDALLPAAEMYQAFIDDSHDKLRADRSSLSCGSNAGMLQRNHPRQHCMSMQCISVAYPNLSILLQVQRCSSLIPVTTATPEHSFSTLKRLKTYLRSSMGDERLTSLALIHVHAQTTPIEPGDEVVDKFALTGPHKLNFLS